MKKTRLSMFAGLIILAIIAGQAGAFQSYTPVVTGGTLIDFEAYTDGTFISTQYPGVTFTQTGGSTYPGITGGSPQIDTYPFQFGYGSSSGNNVLTGSTQSTVGGGYPFPTVAGIVIQFATPEQQVQAFFSDTSPLGNYTIDIYGSGGTLLNSFTLLSGNILPPGYSGGTLPPPGTSPLPGIYVGFQDSTADIYAFQIGPSSAFGDAFAIDDVSYVGAPSGVPEPASLLLFGLGLGGLAAVRRKFKR